MPSTDFVVYSPLLNYTFNYPEFTTGVVKSENTAQIQVDWTGGTMTYTDWEGDSQTFTTLQFHFHAPSEHTVNGKQYDLEVHIVHLQASTNKLAVIGVFFDSSLDVSNCFLESLKLNSIGTTNLEIPVNEFLSSIKPDFYSYSGSLTTPTCDEVVSWIVMKEVQYMSKEQLAYFTSRWADDASFAGGKGTNRITMPLNGRQVYTNSFAVKVLAQGLAVLGVIFVALL